MSCACQTGNRTIAIIVDQWSDEYRNLIDYADSAGWTTAPEHGVVAVPLGPQHPLRSRCELENLLRAMLDKPRLLRLRTAPLQPGIPLTEQVARFSTAGPLIADDAAAESPVLQILERRQIETWVQPVLTRDDRVWGFECLMRARDARGQLIAPDRLLGDARRENLLFMLDRVCRETHITNASRLAAGRDLKVLINFLPTAIYQPQFCLRSTFAAARRCGLPAEQIIFEVVETEQVQNTQHLRRILDEYRSKGFGVAVDDMGSGFSGLQLLAELQPDLIKIDREIVSNAATSHWHASICRLLVQIGQEHGKWVLAEGIETQAQHQQMLDLGVDLFQGYLYGRPAPVDSLHSIDDAVAASYTATGISAT